MMIIYKILVLIYCIFLIINIYRAKNVRGVLEQGFTGVMLMILLLLMEVA